MARGLKLHTKRIATPKHWYLNKLGGVFAPHPSTGPHKIRECLPLAIILRDRLQYALTYNECKMITMQRLIKVDGKVRTDKTYPIGFMDVVSIEKTHQNFRILYDTKGRFIPHAVSDDEARYKLCRIKKVDIGKGSIPYAVTHDGRTIRFIHPDIRAHDIIRYELETGKVLDYLKFREGQVAMITGGHNTGRIGTILRREKHEGSIEIIHLKDARGQEFATQVTNVFVIGTPEKIWVTVPKTNGVRKSNIEDREQRLHKQHAHITV